MPAKVSNQLWTFCPEFESSSSAAQCAPNFASTPNKSLDVTRTLRSSALGFPMRSVLASTVMTLAIVLSSATAAADDPENPYGGLPLTAREKQQKSVLVRDGKKAVEAGQWHDASIKFEEALAMQSDPESLLYKGWAEDKLGHLLSAKASYARAHAEAVEATLTEWVEHSQQVLDDLQKRIPRIVIQMPAGVVGRVYLDSVAVSASAEGFEVDPGKRQIVVNVPGRFSYQTEVNAREGEVFTVKPELPVQALPISRAPEVVFAPKARGSAEGPIALMLSGALVGGIGCGMIVASHDTGVKAGGAVVVSVGAAAIVSGGIWLASRLTSTPPSLPNSPPPQGPSAALELAPMPGGGYLTIRGQF